MKKSGDDKNIQSMGGQARAQKLTRQRRAEIARNAAESRWAKNGSVPPLVARYGTSERPLRIGEIEIPCYVLSDGTRVLAQRGLQSGIGLSESGGSGGVRRIAAFMSRLSEKGIDVKGLVARTNSPIRFVPAHGGNPADGYEATILPDICAVIIDADMKGKLDGRLKRLAERAAILQHGFATIGIIAMVDEATGYQEIRDKDALQKILDEYIGRELAKWAERFPKTFYEQMFRLKGWTYNPGSSKRPMQMARITVDLVFDRIGPGLTKDLRARRNEIFEATGKSGKLHQVLTPDLGHPALAHHLAGLEFTAKTFADGDYEGFCRAVDRAAPKYNRTLLLPFPDEDTTMPDKEDHR
jgi:hypothetical protein